jgi:hypothetical protein
MKKLLLVLCLTALAAHAADQRFTPVDKEITELAKLLQARLPTLAVDGMCEVERNAHGWTFTARVKSEQGGADEVQVIIHEAPGSKSELRVQGVRVDNNLFTSKQGVNAALTAEWHDKILKLVQ